MNQRYQFLITDGAKADLTECKAEDVRAATKISELLRLVQQDQIAAEHLVETWYEDDVIRDVSAVWSLQDKRINAYRVRMMVIHNWRVITAVDHTNRRVAIMAIMHRDENYEDSAGLWERIENEYDGLDFPRY